MTSECSFLFFLLKVCCLRRDYHACNSKLPSTWHHGNSSLFSPSKICIPMWGTWFKFLVSMQILPFKVRYTFLITTHGCNLKDNQTTADFVPSTMHTVIKKLTVEQVDNIADDFWLRQIEQFTLDLTDELQIQWVLLLWSPKRSIWMLWWPASQSQWTSTKALGSIWLFFSWEICICCLSQDFFPCTLIVCWKEHLHYTSIHIESISNMWHLDSKQRKPRKLTMRMVQGIMMDKSCYTFVLVRKLMSHLPITSSSNEGMLPTGASTAHFLVTFI